METYVLLEIKDVFQVSASVMFTALLLVTI